MITSLEISSRALGNSLFSYATLFGVGKKLGLDIKIPSGKNHIHEPTGQNIIQLKDIFNINTPDITQEEINSIKNTYVEKRKDFNPEIFTEVKDNTNLIGFFQAERYFKHCREELQEQLTFGSYFVYNSIRKFTELDLDPKKCISIHRRLGDYQSSHLQPFHPILPLNYYVKSCSHLKKPGDKNDYKYLIFSDNIDICKKEFGDHCIFVDNSEYKEYSAVMDLCMMSMITGGHIIANSSFSWWGAYLSNCSSVCYPAQWFGYGYNNFNIVDVEEWTKI